MAILNHFVVVNNATGTVEYGAHELNPYRCGASVPSLQHQPSTPMSYAVPHINPYEVAAILKHQQAQTMQLAQHNDSLQSLAANVQQTNAHLAGLQNATPPPPPKFTGKEAAAFMIAYAFGGPIPNGWREPNSLDELRALGESATPRPGLRLLTTHPMTFLGIADLALGAINLPGAFTGHIISDIALAVTTASGIFALAVSRRIASRSR